MFLTLIFFINAFYIVYKFIRSNFYLLDIDLILRITSLHDCIHPLKEYDITPFDLCLPLFLYFIVFEIVSGKIECWDVCPVLWSLIWKGRILEYCITFDGEFTCSFAGSLIWLNDWIRGFVYPYFYLIILISHNDTVDIAQTYLKKVFADKK